jgi:glucosamine-6-phosphate deaminase
VAFSAGSRNWNADLLSVNLFPDRRMLGAAAAAAIGSALKNLITARGRANVIFGSAPSQDETLAALAGEDVDWTRITAFHLDEYVGAAPEASYSFSRYLIEHIFQKRPPARFYKIQGDAAEPERECERYASLLHQDPPDMALLGIGQNGHLAFNDPPASFDDPVPVRVTTLADACRKQQVDDGAFDRVEDVPLQAITLTIPALMRVPQLFIIVPGSKKSRAVRDALQNSVSPYCPASILRTHPAATLFLDSDSAAQIRKYA